MDWTTCYKIIVAEDEPPILNNVVQKIESLDLPIQVVGTALDGKTALSLIRQERPQIVITDIRMPGMDGLELCKVLSEEAPDIKIVVLSGYSEFEYARTAIRYQVAEYLLKPVNASKLRETLNALCEELEENLRIVRRRHLERQLSGGADESGLPCQFDRERFHLCLICLGNLQDNDDVIRDTRWYHELWDQTEIKTALVSEPLSCWWLIDEKNLNERMLLSTGGTGDLTGHLFHHISAHLVDKMPVNLCFAENAVEFSEIWNTARQLRVTLRQNLVPCRSGIFSTGDKRGPDNFGNSWLSLMQAVQSGNPTNFRSNLRAFFSEQQENGITQIKLESTVKDILRAVLEQCRSNAPALTSLLQTCNQTIIGAINEHSMYKELEEHLCKAYVENVVDILSAEQLALSVKAYIERNYRQEISMEELTRRFHFSGSYITRLFRTQFGMPPNKYLINFRIQKAKALISSNHDLNLGTVAQMVGYDDQHYFSRLFRLSTGMSPSEYKESLK